MQTPITDPGGATDHALTRRMVAIIRGFCEYSESDPFGWDWATMRLVFPEECAEYGLLRDETLRRLEASGGWFMGNHWTKDGGEKVWNLTEPQPNSNSGI